MKHNIFCMPSRHVWLKLCKTALVHGAVVSIMLGMSSCQSFQTGSGYKDESKYSLKKRKSHISCVAENGGPAVIKPLPLKVSEQSLERLFSAIDRLLGTRYRTGGSTPDGFDCSGFVQYLYKKQFRMILPRTSGELALLGSVVPEDKLMGGDLVFFSSDGNSIDHVGIVTGKNRFAHAASSGVRVNALLDPYYQRHYAFGARIITTD